ncbi:hypothetical protein SCHRY_v1c05830 [Spiroplasma chrysopicola DF-1]|uniref:Uncharacterized protein n=2 Tax=Spiroplasma chrysopicola TaxID=216933 RepID=R4UIN5_9MOLU|nr:hypothetical protein SCHRY_v1c05830 [Spiroplasma chrysopicola DF-1]
MKINNSPIGTYENLFYDETGRRKKAWNLKYSDEFIMKCLKEIYIDGLSATDISRKYEIPIGTVWRFVNLYKYRGSYRYDREGGICDQLEPLLKPYFRMPLNVSLQNYNKAEQIRMLHSKGLSYANIAKELNLSSTRVVDYYVKKLNLPRRIIVFGPNHMW